MARLCLPRALCALLPLVLLSGCATLLGSRRPALAVGTNADSATITDARGNLLGVTPLARPLRLSARRDTLTIAHPARGAERVVVGRRENPITYLSVVYGAGIAFLGLLGERKDLPRIGLATAVLGWSIDRATGSVWLHAPAAVYATLPPPRDPPSLARVDPDPPPSGATAFTDTAVIAETLARLAAAAYEVGCDSTFPRFWLNERDHLVEDGRRPRALSDAESASIRHNVEAALARLREACARANPLAREDRHVIENPLPPIAQDLSAAVLFDDASAAVPDSVLPRLRELARRLSASGDGLTLVVEGFAAPGGSEAYNQALGLARARAVIAVLRAAGLPEGCCVARSYGADPEWLADADADAASPRARYNRRVTFHLAPAEAER